MNVTKKLLNIDFKLFLLISVITFTIFVFTSDAHRYTIDEDETQQQTQKLVTQIPDPQYVQGQSKMEFNYPDMAPWATGPVCKSAILCYPSYIGHSITEVPFFFINHVFHIITKDTVVLTNKDFDDPHYIYWRNSQDPDFTFLELFYGPLFSALSVGLFFLICRTFNFNQKNSVILSLFYGLTSTVWAYSHTSLNGVAVTFFILFGFYFFRKFQKNQSAVNLILCGTSLGFAFLVRPDAILFIIPLFIYLIYNLTKENGKVKKFFSFIVPLVLFYLIYKAIDFARYDYNTKDAISKTTSDVASLIGLPNPTSVFGLLLSPGVGLFIFAPILLTVFFSFPDFYKRNKSECILFLSFVAMFLNVYGGGNLWHGLVAWGARYLLPIVPFLLLPLGASLETRKSKLLKIFLIILGGFGVFFNIVYVIQDISWFVWTYPGSHTGLFGIATASDPLYINPAVLWSFEYSQLTQSMMTAFTHLQPDIFLLKLFGPLVYGLAIIAILSTLIYLLCNLIRSKSKPNDSIPPLNKN